MKVKKADILYNYEDIKNLKEMIEKSTSKYKDNVAFKYKQNGKIIEVTYAQLKEDVDNLGTALIDLGLKNKKIAVIGVNSYQWAVTYLAIVCGVGIVVPIDKALPNNEIENLLEKSEAEAIFFDGKYTQDITVIKQNSRYLKHLVCFEEKDNTILINTLINKGKKLIKQGDTSFTNSNINEKEMSIMLFTSGTTLKSKAVMLSHYNICSNVKGLRQSLKYMENDIILSFLPIHHTYEATITLISGLYNGCCIAFCEGLKHVVQNLADFGITMFPTVPLVLENIYKKIRQQVEISGGKIKGEDVLKLIAPKLRIVLVGAAPLNKEVISSFRSFGLDIRQGYGLTETAPILTVETDNMQRTGSIGVSLPNVDVEIDNPDINGLGEIKAKGPNIMLGYYGDEKTTNEVLKGEWFYTGDLGYIDKDGFLFISGRKKNVIVLKNGKNIFPEEIEVLLNDSPYVLESFVYNKEAKDGDSLICAKIVYNKEAINELIKDDVSEEKIFELMNIHKTNVNKKLPLYKYIREISITDNALVKTTTGKIKRYAQNVA